MFISENKLYICERYVRKSNNENLHNKKSFYRRFCILYLKREENTIERRNRRILHSLYKEKKYQGRKNKKEQKETEKNSSLKKTDIFSKFGSYLLRITTKVKITNEFDIWRIHFNETISFVFIYTEV